MILVSACLLGENCKYNGKNNLCTKICEYLKDKEYKAVCPEIEGGLSTPREPCEIKSGRVYTKSGIDVTDAFKRGAESILNIAKSIGADTVILKQRSPSCGYGKIYDGKFQGRIIVGNGLTAELLIKNGIKVLTEDDFGASSQ